MIAPACGTWTLPVRVWLCYYLQTCCGLGITPESWYAHNGKLAFGLNMRALQPVLQVPPLRVLDLQTGCATLAKLS
jgi:hypothetical protein